MKLIKNGLLLFLFLISFLLLTSCEIVDNQMFIDDFAVNKESNNSISIGNYFNDEKTYLFIPYYLENYKVVKLGFVSGLGFGGNGYFDAKNIKRLYCPNSIECINTGYMKYMNNLNIFYSGKVTNVTPLIIDGNNVYVSPNEYDNYLSLIATESYKQYLKKANVLYSLNDSVEDYYYIDYYDSNSLIEIQPPIPIKENFVFDGWYKEKECINLWDFNNDIIIQNNEEFVVTILYAKWK